MPTQRRKLPDHLRRSLLVLIIFLMGVSIARLLVTMHQQEERIEILENAVAQLLSDTSRLQIPPSTWSNGRGNYTQRNNSWGEGRHTQRSENRRQPAANAPVAAQGNPATADRPTGQGADAVLATEEQPRETKPADAAGTKAHKFTSPHLFDLNTIDSLTLIRIPGIAARTASVILQQRQRYGGFHSPEQLHDFLTWDAAQAYLDEWCTQWFTADAQRIRPLLINQASISELQRHPYISHQQAVEIANYRSRHKRISSATELQQLTSFSSEQLQKLLPYLSFE